MVKDWAYSVMICNDEGNGNNDDSSNSNESNNNNE